MKYPFNYLLQIGYNLSFILITLNKMILSQDVPETCKNISIAKEPLISLDVNDNNFIMAKLNWTAYNLSISHNIIQLYAYPCKSDETKSDIVEIIYNYKSEIVYSPDKHSHIFLHHNCNYTFTIEDGVDCLQKIDFRIPVCVKNNCCDPQRSPVQILEINSIKEQEGIYNVSLNVKEEVDLSNVFYVYRKEDSDIFERVKIHPTFENTSRFQLLEFNFEPEEGYSVWLKYDNGSCQIWSKFYFKEKRNNSLYVIFVIVLCILTILTTLLILKHRKSVWNFIKNFIFFTSTEQIREVPIPLSIKWASNIIYPKKNIDNLDTYEIDRDLITFDEKIGEGEFGMVYKGFAALKPREDIQVVAIKQTKVGAPEKYLNDFKMEIDLMKKIGKHEHIVNFLGCCMESQPNLILMEYLDCGNLKTYLENLRKDWESKKAELEDTRPNIFFPDSMAIPIDSEISDTCMTPGISPGESSLSPLLYNKKRTRLESVLTEKSTTTTTTYVLCSTPDSILKPELSEQELHSFALQIARGMEYLESIKVTHRDLAARNVLIKLTSNEKRLKISDFGFSRVGPYTSYKNEIEPRRWMSIEAIEKHRCDNKSDVWSYGVVLWEIGTLGAFPYETIDDHLILPQLKRGVRLKRPQVSSEKLYDLMMSCWLEDPMERPNFSEVVTILTMEQIPYSLSRINQDYVFPSLNYVQVLGT